MLELFFSTVLGKVLNVFDGTFALRGTPSGLRRSWEVQKSPRGGEKDRQGDPKVSQEGSKDKVEASRGQF